MGERERVGEAALKGLMDRRGLREPLQGIKYEDPDIWSEIIAEAGEAAISAMSEAKGVRVNAPVLNCESCGEPAAKLCQMTTHECDPMPICENCAADHDQKAQEVNDHEMAEFGGAYGLCTYHYLPLPSSAIEPAPVTPAQAAKVLLNDDIALSKMAEAMHDGPLGADEYAYSAANKQGAWCLDCVREALRALAQEQEGE